MAIRNLKGFTKDDSDRIGFAVTAVFTRAISREEFRTWALDVFIQHDSAPLYLMDLSEHQESLSDTFKVIGFVPHFPFGDGGRVALLGIAHLRGRAPAPVDAPASRESTMKALARNPGVREMFKNEFPNILIQYED